MLNTFSFKLVLFFTFSEIKNHGWNFTISKILNFKRFKLLKLAGCLKKIMISCLNGYVRLDNLKINQRSYHNLHNSAFWGWLSIESQPQNPEFRINPENFHPCITNCTFNILTLCLGYRSYFTIIKELSRNERSEWITWFLYNYNIWFMTYL